jgi:hypothetical protein
MVLGYNDKLWHFAAERTRCKIRAREVPP